MARHALAASLFAALAVALVHCTAHADDLEQTLAAFDAAYSAAAQVFAQPTRIQQLNENGEQVSFQWQDGKYREEYRWLGFTEVFSYDGSEHWYGSDINLPYELDGGAPPSITLELCRAFAFLRELDLPKEDEQK